MSGPFNYNRRFDYRLTRKLTSRQLEVLRWLAEGKKPKEIAAIIGLSTRTVGFHLYNSMRVLDCHTVTQTVVKAMRLGLML
jgi:LuxR family transcriptional regulator, quorum-sensing system regulator SolR